MTQSPGTTPAAAGPEGGPRVGDQMRDLTALRRSKDNRIVAGVCEGLSRHFDIDPIVIRVVFAALTIFGGAGIVLYALAWLTIPVEGHYDSPVSGWLRRDPDRILVAGLSIAAVAAIATMIGAIGISAPNPFPAVVVGLLALAVFALFTRRRVDSPTVTPPAPETHTPVAADETQTPVVAADKTTPASPSSTVVEDERPWWRRDPGTSASPAQEGPSEPGDPTVPLPPAPRPAPPPRRPRRPKSRLLSVTLATIAISLGSIWILDETVIDDMEPSVYPGTALGIIAIALLVGTWFGRSRFLIVLGLFASVATAAATVAGTGPYGEEIYRPTAAADVRTTYEHGIGRLELRLDEVGDLKRLDGRDVAIDMNIGQVDLIVPTSIDATITAHVSGGDISGATVIDENDGGSQTTVVNPVDDGDPNIAIDIDLRYGQINLMRLDCPGDIDTATATGIIQVYDNPKFTSGGTRVPAACN